MDNNISDFINSKYNKYKAYTDDNTESDYCSDIFIENDIMSEKLEDFFISKDNKLTNKLTKKDAKKILNAINNLLKYLDPIIDAICT